MGLRHWVIFNCVLYVYVTTTGAIMRYDWLGNLRLTWVVMFSLFKLYYAMFFLLLFYYLGQLIICFFFVYYDNLLLIDRIICLVDDNVCDCDIVFYIKLD